MTAPRPARCPRCGQEAVVPVEYGYPDPQLMDRAERGEAVIGGCVVWPGQITEQCTNCGWPEPKPPQDLFGHR